MTQASVELDKLSRLQLRFLVSVAGWSSLVARWAHNPKVGGSNPPPATKFASIPSIQFFFNPQSRPFRLSGRNRRFTFY